jgi:hypothetical protein
MKMGDPLTFVEGLMTRLQGPMSIRFVMQPAVAIFLAVRDGRKDAREGRPPYFWGLFKHAEHRHELLRSGWKSIGKVFIIAIILDFIFQYVVFRDFRLVGAVLAGLILAIIPYLLFRGPVNRLSSRNITGQNR